MSTKREWRRVIPGGLFGGLVGAATMIGFIIVVSVLRGHDVWVGLKTAASPFVGARALEPGLDTSALLLALAIHVGLSLAWGLTFALLLDGKPRIVTTLAGPVFGLAVWIVMFYLVLPMFGQGALARGTPATPSMVEHVLFGIGVAAGFLPFQRPIAPKVARHPPRWRVTATRHRPSSSG